MPETRRISVVIPCFNHGDFVSEAVASVLNTGREDLELIVIDDGSTDDHTCAEIERLRRDGVRVIRQPNKGLAGARNAAISASTAEYIFPLDADDRMQHGWTDRAIEILTSQPSVGVVYGDAQCFGLRTNRWRTGHFDPAALLDANYIHASALYRRAVWEQNQGYDGTMPVQGLEDWDFWIGALENGWQFVYLPEVFFEYRQTSGSMITRAKGSMGAVEEFVARKHGPLYREAWLRLARERQSAKRTAHRLGTLLSVRLKERLARRDISRWVP